MDSNVMRRVGFDKYNMPEAHSVYVIVDKITVNPLPECIHSVHCGRTACQRGGMYRSAAQAGAIMRGTRWLRSSRRLFGPSRPLQILKHSPVAGRCGPARTSRRMSGSCTPA